jgi:SAM-dependent methyltransferase
MEMTYEDWEDVQVVVHGMVQKPVHYKIAQFQAMEKFIFEREGSVLDVGCGEGAGMLYLHFMGFDVVRGLDVNSEKVKVATLLGVDAVCCSVESESFLSYFPNPFDVIWCSHMLEHAYNPTLVVRRLRNLMSESSVLYIILPYVDTGDLKAHCSSIELGLRIDDGGSYLSDWLGARGFIVEDKKFSTFREPEIWLQVRKND